MEPLTTNDYQRLLYALERYVLTYGTAGHIKAAFCAAQRNDREAFLRALDLAKPAVSWLKE